ncbi:MAG: ABC transporter substrate-binding protein [Desulfofustis sp.]|nr:ABC transporter substrate-binding protein [Desulfofustis sp.]
MSAPHYNHGYLIFLILLFLWCPRFAGALEITDSVGETHIFTAPATRIISLYPAHTENLLTIGAANALIGISTSDSATVSVIDKPRFSYHDSVEKFIQADPDCVLIRPMISRSNPNLISKLRDYGIRVVSLQPTSVTELYEYWQTLGTISGFEPQALEMINKFQQEITSIQASVETILPQHRPKVYFESIHSRMRTFSPESISIFCLTTAGGINVAEDAVSRRGTNIAGYSKERILARAEEIDVYLAQFGRMNRISVEQIAEEPGFRALKAVRSGQVYLIDEHLVSRPTPRLLEGIRMIHKILYPG